MLYKIVFIDSEIGIDDKNIKDLGAIKDSFEYVEHNDKIKIIKRKSEKFHSKDKVQFSLFLEDADFICGHNIFEHDLKYISKIINTKKKVNYIDTLYLSALIFPKKEHHNLQKNDKLNIHSNNNPLNDCIKDMELFYNEIETFLSMNKNISDIFCGLLYDFREFQGFFNYLKIKKINIQQENIKEEFKKEICTNSDIKMLINNYHVELSYVLSNIKYSPKNKISSWTIKKFPKIENIYNILKGKNCHSCTYCKEKMNPKTALKKYFGFENFRTYNSEPLQEKAVNAAIDDKSLIAIFPTGGGKSLTFQLPALIKGELTNALTVVISPLQSLMKDQVDNLNERGIITSVFINGLLDPIEKANAIKSVKEGFANILYLSPESLRTYTMEKILSNRNIERFVIDEAHCFSSWGQDFRVDYLYIADFINKIKEKKSIDSTINVSCFTATAKQKVISDIKDYFFKKMNIELEVFSTEATRENLHYNVLFQEDDDEKYSTVRRLIQDNNCPTIVYTSRTRTTRQIAEKLNNDGINARAYNGKMDSSEKIKNQDDFINDKVQVIVATSAFGMGVDKDDVQLVIHYDISNSLENYIQEAGRAGRNASLEAKCYILYNDDDLDKHFMLLNQTKLSMSEIQNIWRAIKYFTKDKNYCSKSALEIAREAGWDENSSTVEIRVKTAIGALENAGYIKRGYNKTRVYASSINCKNMIEASKQLENLKLPKQQDENCRYILSALFSAKNDITNKTKSSKIDYLSDVLGIKKQYVIESINIMRENSILKDDQDMTATILGTKQKAIGRLNRFSSLEEFLIGKIDKNGKTYNLKELNEMAIEENIRYTSVKNIKTIHYFWLIKDYIKKNSNNINKNIDIFPKINLNEFKKRFEIRIEIAKFVIDKIYKDNLIEDTNLKEKKIVNFSVIDILKSFQLQKNIKISAQQIEEAILYLSKIGSLNVEGGFLVLYNPMTIYKQVRDNRIKYKIADYEQLNNFYKQKIQQIHIVGEFANMMVKNYKKALEFVRDYFNMDYRDFIYKYFDEKRRKEINRNITGKKYKKLFNELSEKQLEIIEDDNSKTIVVAAGPGSGKTKILVHKLASLLLLEDIKSEQLLMVTFSRSAATEFKKRLTQLIGEAANFVQIKTFHSYCFDIIGEVGNLEKSENIVRKAIEKIKDSSVELNQITKSVIVIDEAQDMDKYEFELIQTLMQINEEIRIILVGDDDQNIYEFRGSDSKYMASFIKKYNAKKYELVTNYRSKASIVEFSNIFANTIKNRIKVNPCIAYDKTRGTVKLTKHLGKNMEVAIVDEVESQYDEKSICILTNTNDEALRINGLLTHRKINSNLIQSNDGFKLINLLEIRYFLNIIEKNTFTPIITQEVWEMAKHQLEIKFEKSTCLENCMNMIEDIQQTKSNIYLTDLMEFVKESNYEDFYTNNKSFVTVSTIHKSKGREFDKVYMILNDLNIKEEQEKRKLFVGMTRAKEYLSIHYNNDIFDNINMSGIITKKDEKNYPKINHITLQLSYEDVYLDFFKKNKKNIFWLYSGVNLYIKGNYLYANISGKLVCILKYSRKFIKKIEYLKKKGFVAHRACIRYIVAWKDKEEDKEYPIILPDIYLSKINKNL